MTKLTAELAELTSQVTSFAVAGHFATRNPRHEQIVRNHLKQQTGLPVTCSHELSDALGGPRRALTTVLNARLISMLDKLIKATSGQMEKLGLIAELMVVKGDGTLVDRPIMPAHVRLKLSCLALPPAYRSRLFSKHEDVIVADIGGTTTDIALLRGGVVQTSADGRLWGGWRTNVEAAQIHTSGLGGDSVVSVRSRI